MNPLVKVMTGITAPCLLAVALAACGSATPAPVATTLDADDPDGLRVVPAGIESAAKTAIPS